MDQQRTQWFSLYHSLQHYKYHTYLMCKDEVRLFHTRLLRRAALEPPESSASLLLLCSVSCRLRLFGCMRENWGRWRRSRSVCRTGLGSRGSLIALAS